MQPNPKSPLHLHPVDRAVLLRARSTQVGLYTCKRSSADRALLEKLEVRGVLAPMASEEDHLNWKALELYW